MSSEKRIRVLVVDEHASVRHRSGLIDSAADPRGEGALAS